MEDVWFGKQVLPEPEDKYREAATARVEEASKRLLINLIMIDYSFRISGA